ncbi:elongation factor P lysine(34) lysyltransferase, partial [Buchnera aphidicola]|nr:elongation factor P lysine(34) lysyltransferase [Buchnera aphidicola]
NIGKNEPLIIYHFPVSQASLAAVNNKDDRISDRFEIFFKGIELGNGFYELTDYSEQKRRFMEDNKTRVEMNLPVRNLDPFFLDALSSGLSPCSGVAIGLDRLIMLILNKKSISEVMAFSLNNC